jgi:hypothetical protein
MRAQSNRLDDKRLLQGLSDALATSGRRIRLDPCGDWNILGARGHIFTDAKLWYVFVAADSKRRWTSIKHKLSFMHLSQDADDEGVMKLERMPTPAESKIIRKVLGLRQKTQLTEDQQAELKSRFNPSPKGVSEAHMRQNKNSDAIPTPRPAGQA